MNPDIVFQMGTMVVKSILTAMKVVGGLATVILLLETFRYYRNRETRLQDNSHQAKSPVAHDLALRSVERSPRSGDSVKPQTPAATWLASNGLLPRR